MRWLPNAVGSAGPVFQGAAHFDLELVEKPDARPSHPRADQPTPPFIDLVQGAGHGVRPCRYKRPTHYESQVRRLGEFRPVCDHSAFVRGGLAQSGPLAANVVTRATQLENTVLGGSSDPYAHAGDVTAPH